MPVRELVVLGPAGQAPTGRTPSPLRASGGFPSAELHAVSVEPIGFLHWAVDPEAVAALLPPGTWPDVHDGRTYVGLVPFRMVGTGFAVGPTPDGPLERFLTARWGLHAARSGRTRYLPNAHPPWPLRTAEVVELDDGLVAAAGLGDLARRPPDHVVFSDGVAATFGRPVPATRLRPGAVGGPS